MPRKTPIRISVARIAGSFNEAAARCRGKRYIPGRGGRGLIASMRPRPDAAENAGIRRAARRAARLQ